MKRNVNVFLAVVLVAMLCGGIIWLRTAKDEKLGWNIHDTYGEAPAYANNGAAYTNATFAGPSNDGGVMTLSPSRAMRHSAASSYAGAYAISYGVNSMPLTSNLSPLTSGGAGGGQGLYTTSSKTFNSYGGGNGGAMSYSQSPIANHRSNSGSSNPSLQGGAGVGSISPIAYSTARRGTMSSVSGDELMAMPAENPVMAMASAANAGMTSSFYGAYSAMDYSSADYGQYAGMFGGSRSNVRGRQNSGNTNSLLDWFYRYGHTYGDRTGNDTDGWVYTFSNSQLQEAYNAYIENYWDDMWGTAKPTFEEWLAWLEAGGETGYEYNGNWYKMLPVGDVLPLFVLALLYALLMFVRNKFAREIKTKLPNSI